MIDQFTLIILGIVASLICIAITTVSLMTAYMLKRRMNAMQIDLDKKILMFQTGVQGIGNRVLELENRLAGLRESQKDLSTSTQDFVYSKARSLIREGMSDAAIAETSGLTLSEVGLMKLVHSREGGQEQRAYSGR
jgi:hypothetical protein